MRYVIKNTFQIFNDIEFFLKKLYLLSKFAHIYTTKAHIILLFYIANNYQSY